MAFWSILPEDVQRCVIQSWVLPEKASTSAVLKLWSRLDRACCNHGLQPYLRSPYPWQMRDTGADDRHALGIRDLGGFCRWITARGVYAPEPVPMPLTLPMVDHLKLLPHSMELLEELSHLCPNVTTVTAPPDFATDEELQFLTSVQWSIKVKGWPEGDALQRIGLHIVSLDLSSRVFDTKALFAITTHCPNLRIVNLLLPVWDIPDFAVILILMLLRKCVLCEELTLQKLSAHTGDATDIISSADNLKSLSFPDWNENTEQDSFADIMHKCPSLDYLRIGTCSFDRKTKTLKCGKRNRLLHDSDWVHRAGIEHLTIACSLMSEAEILPQGLGAHLLTLKCSCGTITMLEHCFKLQELLISWDGMADIDLALIGKSCPQLRLLHLSVGKKTGKLTQNGVLSLLDGCPQLKSLSLHLFKGILTKTFLKKGLPLSCRLETITFGRSIRLSAGDVEKFRQTARKMQLLPVPAIQFA